MKKGELLLCGTKRWSITLTNELLYIYPFKRMVKYSLTLDKNMLQIDTGFGDMIVSINRFDDV